MATTSLPMLREPVQHLRDGIHTFEADAKSAHVMQKICQTVSLLHARTLARALKLRRARHTALSSTATSVEKLRERQREDLDRIYASSCARGGAKGGRWGGYTRPRRGKGDCTLQPRRDSRSLSPRELCLAPSRERTASRSPVSLAKERSRRRKQSGARCGGQVQREPCRVARSVREGSDRRTFRRTLFVGHGSESRDLRAANTRTHGTAEAMRAVSPISPSQPPRPNHLRPSCSVPTPTLSLSKLYSSLQRTPSTPSSSASRPPSASPPPSTSAWTTTF